MPSTVAGVVLRADGSPYRGASFRINTIVPGGIVAYTKIVVTGETGAYSVTLNPSAGVVYQYVPLSSGLPPAFYFNAPASGTTVDLFSLAPIGTPVDVDAAAILQAAINEHIADETPHPNYDVAVISDHATPSASWYVNHGLNRKANVQVVVSDRVAITDVEVTDTYVHATFASPQSGQLVIT